MDRTATITEVVPNLAHWLTPEYVAEQLGVSYLTALGWVTRGIKTDAGRKRLRAKKLGGRWKIDPAAVGPFVDAMTQAALGEGADVAPPPEPATVGRRRVKESLARLRAAGVVG
jgi:hypothetical protein